MRLKTALKLLTIIYISTQNLQSQAIENLEESISVVNADICWDPEIREQKRCYDQLTMSIWEPEASLESMEIKSSALSEFETDLMRFLEIRVRQEGYAMKLEGGELQNFVNEVIDKDNPYTYLLSPTIVSEFFKDPENKRRHGATYCRLVEAKGLQDIVLDESRDYYLKVSIVASIVGGKSGLLTSLGTDVTLLTGSISIRQGEVEQLESLGIRGEELELALSERNDAIEEFFTYVIFQAAGFGAGKAFSYAAAKSMPYVKNGVLYLGDKALKNLTPQQISAIEASLLKARNTVNDIIGKSDDTANGLMKKRFVGNARPIKEQVENYDYFPDRIFMDYIPKPIPPQGWKLHVSADATSAREVAELVLPKLREMGVAHKVVNSTDDLTHIMTGTQEGKFITIYPDNPEQAKLIAKAIDEILSNRALSAPVIQGEKALGSSGHVYTRYGEFTNQPLQRPNGSIDYKDYRGETAPDWVDSSLWDDM